MQSLSNKRSPLPLHETTPFYNSSFFCCRSPQHQYLVIPNRTLPALSPWFCQGCVMWSHDSAQVCARQITHLRAATETVRRQRESFFTSYDGPFARVRARWRCGGWWLALSNQRRLRPETPRERPVPSGGSSRPNAGA